MKIYKENISRWEKFFSSDYFLKLNNENSKEILWIIHALNLDPDQYDKDLYIELGKKFNLKQKNTYLINFVKNENILLSADIICGYPQMISVSDNNYQKFLEIYKILRGNLNLHFLWPKHKAPSINTLRYSKYKDRIDCLLYDLKLYFDGNITPMKNAYDIRETKIWLSQFANFNDFINKMKLTKFVDDNYNVYDLSSNKFILLNKVLTRKEIDLTINDYLLNIIKLSKENYFN